MKDSVLVGAACDAPIKSRDTSPSGSTKGPEKAKGTKFKEVVKSNEDRKASGVKGPQFTHNIGGK